MMFLLTADSLPPFTSLLFASAFFLFFSLSFSHNLYSFFPFTVSSSQNFLTHYFFRLIRLQCRRQKVIVLPAIKGKRLPLMIRLLKPWVERLPIPNRTGVMIQVVSALLSLTCGTISIFTSPWCLVTTCLLHQVECGFPFAIMTPKSLRLLWLPLFSTSTSAKGLHYPCPFSSNLVRLHLWVGKSGWTWSYLMWVLWRHYSRPVC